MSHRIRAARPDDAQALYDLAKLTGGGFTNLPADRATLEAKLARSEMGFSRSGEAPADDLYVFVLEDFETKAIRGTCQVFGQVGVGPPILQLPPVDAYPEERGTGADLPQPDAYLDDGP
jgi:arginine N-succinyltransferase